jgi:SAM-dependent methyltransferase
LDYAREYCAQTGGRLDVLQDRLVKRIVKRDRRGNEELQDLLEAFLPDYESRLFEYYSYQQFFILMILLQYPFLEGGLWGYHEAYRRGADLLGEMHVLEYGCGIPYGLIDCLLTQPGKVKSIGLVDLDLVYTDFAEFVVRKIAPTVPLQVFRLRDAKTFPLLTARYNFFFGKDIFEHLHDPEGNLRKLLAASVDASVCYFDFNDHGMKVHQHITPDIRYLAKVMVEHGFRVGDRVTGCTEFTRNL